MPELVTEAAPRRQGGETPFAIELELTVKDRDVIAELIAHPEGREREEFALEALKIGVLALRRASSALDGEFIKRETDRLLESLADRLENHGKLAKERIDASLRDYFHPESGQFSQRVRRLTGEDGELNQVLKGLIDGDSSSLAKTLVSHVGAASPLMKLLSPDQSQGLLATLRTVVEAQLQQQSQKFQKEFSLDNGDGALARLVKELTAKHGDLSKDFQAKFDAIKKEFSLDEEDSSLNRLVRNVDRAQRTITNEFSLDNEQSALRRLKDELTTILSAHVKTAAEFQEDVKVALGKLVTKKEVEATGTQHGLAFEQAVFEFVDRQARQRGDLAEFTGNTTGLIKNCKLGDVVLQLGAEHAAAGARIVVEAKEDAAYTLSKAQDEMQQARTNRGAQHGVFVFSRQSAGDREPIVRQGADVFVVWNPEDARSDGYFQAALEIVRALSVRSRSEASALKIDFEPLERAMNNVETCARNFDEIDKYAHTIKTSSEKILNRVRIDRDALDKQVAVLREALGNVKGLLGEELAP